MLTNEKWTVEIELLRSIIARAPLVKSRKWGGEVFTYDGRNVLSIGGFKNHFTVWFFNGVFLKDTYKVLVSAKEETKSLRQWRFTSKNEINEQKILEYIYEAIEVEKLGLKIKPEKFSPLPLPQLLLNEFSNDKTFHAAFENLSPGKQKEYTIYINKAKQELTKINRLIKIKPLILQGVGLNDKYK